MTASQLMLWLCRSCLGNHIVEILWMHLPCHAQKIFFQETICSYGFYSPFVPSSVMCPEPFVTWLYSRCTYSLGPGNSIVGCSLHFNDLWNSVMVTTCHKKEFLWWGIRFTLVCRYKNSYLEWSWELYWFKKMAVVDYPQGAMTSLVMVSWLGF